MAGSKKISIEQRLRRFPPIVCRLLAREGGRHSRLLTDKEISERSKLSEPRVIGLSHLLTWNDVPCGQMLDFTRGCGVLIDDRDSMHKHWRHIRGRGAFIYLKKEPDYETRWKPMYQTYVNYLRNLKNAPSQNQ